MSAAILALMNPMRWLYAAIAGVVLLASYPVTYKVGHYLGDQAGYERKAQEIRVADAQAKAQQASQNTTATVEYVTVKGKTVIKYRDSIQEVIKYVEKSKADPTRAGCTIDDEFIRVYNADGAPSRAGDKPAAKGEVPATAKLESTSGQ